MNNSATSVNQGTMAASSVASIATDVNAVILVTAGYDHTIRFWEALSGLCYKTLQHSESQVNALCISPDKRLIVAAGNPHLRVYDIASASTTPMQVLEGHTGNVTAVGFQKEGRWLYSGSEDGSVRVWDLRTASGNTGQFQTPNNRKERESTNTTTTTNTNETLLHNNQQTHHNQPANQQANNHNNNNSNNNVLVNLNNKHCQRDYEHGSAVNDVALHPNQGELVSCSQSGSIKIWDLAADACTHELVPEEDVAMRSVSVASDGSMLVAANSQGHCFVWRMVSSSSSSSSVGGAVGGVASSTSIPTSTDLQPITRLEAHPNHYITKCRFSPDVRKLATAGSDGTIKIWDTLGTSDPSNSNNKVNTSSSPNVNGGGGGGPFSLERTLTGHQRWVWDLVFSADSAYMISASSDQVARLWDLSNGDTLRHYTGHNKAIVAIALHDLP